MQVAVFGATGDQGAGQLRRLLAAGHSPVAISRKPAASTQYETRAADFADHASLIRAIEGVDAIFLNFPSTSFNAADPLIEAAGVIANAAAQSPTMSVLVFNTSLPVSKEKMGYMAQDARVDMRARILASGVPAVIVQPVVFLDNLLKAWCWPGILAEGRIVYPHAETLDVTWICHDDIADLMIAAMTRPHLAGRIFAIGGGETVRGPQLAAKLSRAWRRKLTFHSLGVEDYAARMYQVFSRTTNIDADRLVGELIRNYRRYNESPDRPFHIDMAPVLKELPVTLCTIEDWAARQALPPDWPYES